MIKRGNQITDFMALYKFKEFYPNYQESFGDSEIRHLDSYEIYTTGDKKIGSVKNLLVDQTGRFRYIVADTGFWVFGKQVLLPIGLAHFDYDNRRVYVDGLTEKQVENLPEYKSDMVVDEAYENRVREGYRTQAESRRDRKYIVKDSSSSDVSPAPVADLREGSERAVSTHEYDYEREPAYYGMSETDNQKGLKLYEERLVTDKHRRKAGEVAVNKRVESETARASVPVEKERVVVERHDTNSTRPAAVNEDMAFREGEVARMDVYEEEADIEKQAYVREEVNIRKEVDRDTVDAQEEIRREEVDVDTKGNPKVNRTNNPSKR